MDVSEELEVGWRRKREAISLLRYKERDHEKDKGVKDETSSPLGWMSAG